MGRPTRKPNDGGVATIPVRLEALEVRALLSATPATPCAATQLSLQPTGATVLAGYSPQQIRNAYGFDQVSFSAGTIPANGAGQTIAIVDAYTDPNLVSDLHVFDQQFGFGDPPSLQQVGQTGGAQVPATNSGWAAEISLDVEWAHAIAPAANILVVEANSSDLNDLLAAVNSARNTSGVSVVSMSWGTPEFAGEPSLDPLFTTPIGHQGVSFVASSGDGGAAQGPTWPGASGNVISVGGTTLSVDANGNYAGETAWSGSGQGVSSHEPEPVYQAGVQKSGARVVPDVSFDADPNTGYSVYDSIPDQGKSGWQLTGGTSAGAPQWAGLIAIANQGRATAGLSSLDGATQTLPALYQASASAFNTISQGTNSFITNAQTNYEPGTGLGSPKATVVATDLGDATPPPPLPVILTSNNPRILLGGRRFHPHIVHPGGPPTTNPSVTAARVISDSDREPNRTTSSIANFVFASSFSGAVGAFAVASTGRLAAEAPIFPRAATSVTGLSLIAAIKDGALLSKTAGAVVFEQAAATLRAVASRAAPLAQVAAQEIVAAADAPAVAANVVTNFIHVNALTAFADATAAFINECATVPNAPTPTSHRTRAWLITAGVLAVDALLVAHWYATRPKEEDEKAQQEREEEDLRFPLFDSELLPDSRCG